MPIIHWIFTDMVPKISNKVFKWDKSIILVPDKSAHVSMFLSISKNDMYLLENSAVFYVRGTKDVFISNYKLKLFHLRITRQITHKFTKAYNGSCTLHWPMNICFIDSH